MKGWNVHWLMEEGNAARIKTQEHLSERFNSDTRVKQGLYLWPTLFRLYIENLEEWINEEGGGRLNIDELIILILTLGLRTISNLQYMYSTWYLYPKLEMDMSIGKSKAVKTTLWIIYSIAKT